MSQPPAAETAAIAQLLQQCEQNGTAPAYAGRIRMGIARPRRGHHQRFTHRRRGVYWNYSGTEDFFADAGFVRFVQSLGGGPERKTILVIGRRFVDFLVMMALPD